VEETRVPEEIEAMRLVAANIIVCVYCFLFSKRERCDDTTYPQREENQEKFKCAAIFVCGVVNILYMQT
jgi:hypothetical protein